MSEEFVDTDLLYARDKVAAALHQLVLHPGALESRLLASAPHFLRTTRAAMPDDETRRLWDAIATVFTQPHLGLALQSLDAAALERVALDVLTLDTLLGDAIQREDTDGA
jgi:hypothetical protein